MANLFLGEYCDVGSTNRGSLAIPLEPPLAEQAVEIGNQSSQSKPLRADTCIVKLISDADCAIAIGSDPDATNSVRFLAAGKEQTIAVPPNSNLKVAVVASGSGSMSDSLGAFLKIIASPEDAKKKLDELTKQAAVIDASAQSLRVATDAHKQAKADADAALRAASDAADKASQGQADLAKQQSQFEAQKDEYAAKLKADAAAADLAAKSLADRQAALASDQAELLKRSDNVAAAVSELDARAKDVADRERAADALKDDYEARIAKLKALTA
jgi:hypothetical protein